MEYAGEVRGRDRIAIAVSIAVHLCAVAALLAIPTASFQADVPDERTLLASLIRLEHRPPPPPHVRRSLVPHTETAELPFRPVIRAAVTVEHASRPLVVAAEARNAYAPRPADRAPVIAQTANAGMIPANLPVAATPTPTPAPAATPPAAIAASPAPAATPVVAQSEEGIGNFGETYPASIDPALRGGLTAVGSGFVVRVAVDENGHATAVDFVRAPADATLREELRTKLLATRFIPAACNGLRCSGTVELRT
ncbi:MAG TPA: hypothetical protein VHT05_14645 [Candidatus Elarobacter sp.]|jgi:hypothetical protein|nr:hypothetical protein [Candidatus Elarobacter sp.]